MIMAEQQIVWSPTQEFMEGSQLSHYQHWLSQEQGLTLHSYTELWQWSVDHPDDFWETLWKYFAIMGHTPYRNVRTGDSMPDVKWFTGATLNYAEHIFRQRNEDHPALEFVHESGRHRTISWAGLEEQVAKVRQFLVAQGIRKGDRIAGFLPNIPEAIIAFLATNSVGAIWSCCSPDFGERTVIDRFAQIEPKLL